MVTTMTMSKRLWESAARESYACLYHAFVLGIGCGELPLESFRTFLLQDAFFLHGFLQAFAYAITKTTSSADTITLVSLMQGVNDELKLHDSYMQSWGIDAKTVEKTKPTTATRAYVDFLLTTAKTSQSVSEILAAMVPCARLYAFLGQRLHAANSNTNGNSYSKWVETYTTEAFENSAVLIENLLDATAERESIAESRLSPLYGRAMQLEYNFFEAYYSMKNISAILTPVRTEDNGTTLVSGTATNPVEHSGSILEFVLAQRRSNEAIRSMKIDLKQPDVSDAERLACIAAIVDSTSREHQLPSFQSQSTPTVLCIAGSDSGGGAGIQADLKACTAQGVFSTSAITAITVQNTHGVHGIHNIPIETLESQINCVLDDIGADAIKTGMLATEEIIRCVVRTTKNRGIPLVVDPVMVSTSGHRLLHEQAHKCLVSELFPLAEIITPNLPEASVLLNGRIIQTVDAMKQAAKDLHQLGGSKYVLVKGGHLENQSESVIDVLYDGEQWELIESPRVNTSNTHGTGCTLAAAIAANYAKMKNMPLAVRLSIRYVQRILCGSQDVKVGTGENGPMLHWLCKMKLFVWAVSKKDEAMVMHQKPELTSLDISEGYEGEFVEDSSMPGYLMTYLTFFACGATLVSSWTCFVLSIDAFDELYPDGMVGFLFPVVNMSSLLVITMFMLVAGRQLPLNQRMVGGFSFLLLSILCVPLLQLCDGYLHLNARYVATLAMVILTSMSSALLQSSVYGVGAVFGSTFLQAIDAGKGTCAVILVTARIATKWAFDQEVPGMLSMDIFFGIAFLTIATSFGMYLTLAYNDYARPKLDVYLQIQLLTPLALPLPSLVRSPYRQGITPFSPTETTPLTPQSITFVEEQRSGDSILNVFRQAWKPVSMSFFTFCICLSCYPGLTTSIESQYISPTWFPVILTAAFTIADLVGKSLPLYVRLFTVETIHYPIVIQLAFIPLFVFDIVHPYVLPDAVAILFVALLGLVTGYVGTSSMILAPTTCSEVEHELAGITGSMATITGLFAGSYLGLVLKFVVQILQGSPSSGS